MCAHQKKIFEATTHGATNCISSSRRPSHTSITCGPGGFLHQPASLYSAAMTLISVVICCSLVMASSSFGSLSSSSVTFPSAHALRIGVVGPTLGTIAPPMMAVYDGFRLAMHEQNANGGIQGAPIEWLFAPSTVNVSGQEVLIAESVVDQWMSSNATKIDCLAVPPSALLTNALDRAAEKHNLTVFGPASGERSDFLQYTTRRVLVSGMPDAEIAALIRYIVLTRNLRRIAVMTTYGRVYGNDLLPYIATLLAEFGLEIVHNYVCGTPNQTTTELAVAGMGKKAQVVLMLANIDTNTVAALIGVYSTMNLLDDWIIGTVMVNSPLFPAIFAKLPAGAAGRNNLLTSTYIPIAKDTEFESVRDYNRLLDLHSATMVLPRPLLAGANSILGAFSIAGYMVGSMMTSVFRNMGSNPINSATIVDATFNGWAIPVKEFIFGPYSKPCVAGRTKVCGCHSGIREIHLAYFDAALDVTRIPAATIDISMDICLPTNVPIQSPLIQLVATPTSNTDLLSADARELAASSTTQYVNGDRAGYVNATVSPSSRTGILMERSYNTASDLIALQSNRLTTISTGSIYAERIDNGSSVPDRVTAVLDPLYTVPMLHGGRFNERVVHLMPTLEQEIHALSAVYASGGGSGGFKILTTVAELSTFAKDLAEVCRKSSHTFGRPYDEKNGVRVVSSIAAGLSGEESGANAPAAVVMVHGIHTKADIAAIDTFLAQHPSAVVIVPFHHLALWYDVIVATVAQPSRRQRVVFATSLPSWNPISTSAQSNTALMQSYYGAMLEEGRGGSSFSPQSLRGFLTQRLVANIVERIPLMLTQSTFLSTLYAVSVVVLDATAYAIGPLGNAACSGSGSGSATNCETNVGARHLWVRSLEGELTTTPSAASSYVLGDMRFASGVIDYRALPSEDSAVGTLAIVLIVVGVVAALLIVVVVLMKLFSGRSHANAPKDEKKPFTIIFTDIQSSTSLWAEVPEEMGRALEVHHSIIRDLIKRHNGYEVKTIGDAFMIAFKSADDAVKLAFALQYAFYECEAFPPVIDQAYLSFDRERQAVEAVPNLTCDLSSEDYSSRWRGLRVRVGIHTDFGTIQKDPVTDAYDYYGTVTNTAARVEAVSHGGQVCFTEGTLSCLSNDLQLDINSTDVLAPEFYAKVGKSVGPLYALRMGEKELRGLSNNVMMYQLECIAGRLYPPLRLEVEDDSLGSDYDDDGNVTTTAGGTGTNTITDAGTQRGSVFFDADASRRLSRHPSEGGGGGVAADARSVTSSKGGLGGLGGGGPHNRTFTAEMSSLQVMVAIFTLFSRVPQPEKRLKEYRRLCDLWGVKVDKKSVEKAKQTWAALKPSASEANSNKAMAMHLAKEDAAAAAHVETLSRRVRNIMSKNLQNTIVATHGVGALRGVGGGSPQHVGGFGGGGVKDADGSMSLNGGSQYQSSLNFVPTTGLLSGSYQANNTTSNINNRPHANANTTRVPQNNTCVSSPEGAAGNVTRALSTSGAGAGNTLSFSGAMPMAAAGQPRQQFGSTSDIVFVGQIESSSSPEGLGPMALNTSGNPHNHANGHNHQSIGDIDTKSVVSIGLSNNAVATVDGGTPSSTAGIGRMNSVPRPPPITTTMMGKPIRDDSPLRR